MLSTEQKVALAVIFCLLAILVTIFCIYPVYSIISFIVLGIYLR